MVEAIQRRDDIERQIRQRQCLISLERFTITFWDVIIENELVWSEHMSIMCNEIERVYKLVFERRHKEHDLIINIPPGTSKTTICSIMATCWAFANMPSIRILITSFSDDAVISIADKVKLILNSDKYKNLFGWVEIRKDVNNKHNLKTTKNGEFYASSVNGTITSKHFDILGVDDPINPKDIDSRSAITNITTKFFARTLPTRKVDKAVTPLILIMQRLGIQDPTAYLIEKRGEDIRHVVLPATNEYAVKPEIYKDIYVNGLLDPIRLSQKILSDAKRDLGLTEYAGQFGQSPVPFGGNIIKDGWITIIEKTDYFLKKSLVFNYFLDTAYTKDTKNDPTGMLTATIIDGDLIVYDYWAKHLELFDCVNEIENTYNEKGDIRSKVIIENKASGISINTELKRKFKNKMNIFLYNVKGKKEDRLRSYEGYFQSGKVKLVKGDWNEAFIAELTGYPDVPHDESIDCITMALNYYLVNASRGQRKMEIY
jgi:phage uncharacterized protein (putative large terminase), C-terminal domain